MATAPRVFRHPLAAAYAVCLLAARARAAVTLPAVFSDHMVLQREASVPVWGWAEPGEQVTVSFAGQSQKTAADVDGKWSTKLEKLQPGEPQVLTVRGTNTLTVSDVLVGEVWLCSGQSNMQLPVGRVDNFEKEKAAADFPKLRMFNEASPASDKMQVKGSGKWIVCSPETVAGFSGVAYFFGRELHKTLGVPVGLVKSAVGGTVIEAWTSLDSQKDLPELKPLFDGWEKKQTNWDPAKAQAAFEKQLATYKENAIKAKAAGKTPPTPPKKPVEPRVDPNHPATLFNGKISPLIPYAIKGAIWYQGESNGNQGAKNYGLQLKTLINDWRARWGEGDFPFDYVQLPNINNHDDWPWVRDGMLKDLSLPHTGMAVTIDVGNPTDVHPTNKQDPGHRLALWALGEVYGQKVPSTSGPVPTGSKVEGSTIVCTFNHADGGLVVKGGGTELKGFVIAGEDKKWLPADAKIVGETIVVSSPQVKSPVAVRYAWASNPECNLLNGAGLPATPFRTDDWP